MGDDTDTTAGPPLHAVLRPLILGTATFNTQHVLDPHSMPSRRIVARAMELGITAFDTSPYYGPAEMILGDALAALSPTVGRRDYMLSTKAGRIAGDEFDYSPAWTRYSVLRSLRRLRTSYLDLVYAHDVEFVSDHEVLAMVGELRRLRADGLVRYVGISGFPLDRLCALAERVRDETGEPLDAVLSYGHFTVQNTALGRSAADADDDDDDQNGPLERFLAAGVDVVLNASMLGMGLLTSRGIPVDAKEDEETAAQPSPLAKWHPSPPGLRLACQELARLASADGERLEAVALRWSLEEWARVGAAVGLGVDMKRDGAKRSVGASVMGVGSVDELEETVREWEGVLAGLTPMVRGHVHAGKEPLYKTPRQKKIMEHVQGKLWPALGEWKDYAWESPDPAFKNIRREEDRGLVPLDDGITAGYEGAKRLAKLAGGPF